jgi:hypothetical protein
MFLRMISPNNCRWGEVELKTCSNRLLPALRWSPVAKMISSTAGIFADRATAAHDNATECYADRFQ